MTTHDMIRIYVKAVLMIADVEDTPESRLDILSRMIIEMPVAFSHIEITEYILCVTDEILLNEIYVMFPGTEEVKS